MYQEPFGPWAASAAAMGQTFLRLKRRVLNIPDQVPFDKSEGPVKQKLSLARVLWRKGWVQPFLGSASRRYLFLKIFEEVRQKYEFQAVGYMVMP